MEYSIFKKKVESLKMPWSVSPERVYCPLYMLPNQGYVIYGKTFTCKEWENELEDMFTDIINTNRMLKIHKAYVEVFLFKTKEYIKILC